MTTATTTATNDAVTTVATDVATIGVAPSFESLDLPRPLLAAVRELGFATPTAIQAAAIPALLSGRDVTGVAQTGTGKTAAFGLPLLAAVDTQVAGVQALVLTPTRELALQVADALRDFAAGLPGVQVIAVYGGAPMGPQLSALRRGAQVVVGTPGRIIDHLDRGSLHLDTVRFAVLDEADEMLRMGFAEDVDRILTATPADRQTALFSATMPDAIRTVAARHLRRPVDVSVAASATPVPAIRQRYAVLPFRQKVDALVRILAVARPGSTPAGIDDAPADTTGTADAAVVFVRTRGACEEVGAQLTDRGISAAVISGDVTQRERERTIARLRARQVDVLVATDVAARGLDVERIGLVVNFDAPSDPETYVHRIGRTGRAGRTGEALLFVTPRELHRVRAIERATGQRLVQMTPPTAAEVAAHRAAARLRAATARQTTGRLEAFRNAIDAAVRETGLPVTELAAALLAVAVGDDGAAPTTEVSAIPAPSGDRSEPREHRESRERRERPHRGAAATTPESAGATEVRRGPGSRRGPDTVRYVVQVGRRHGVRPAGIVGAITGEGGLSGSDVGRIDIFDQHSVVEIARPVGGAALSRIRRATVSGQQLRIQRDRADGPNRPAGRSGPAASSRTPIHAGGRRTQNRAGWSSTATGRSRAGRLPSGKRDSALPGTPRTS